MTHQHHHHHDESTQSLQITFFLNLTFTVAEIIGGMWTNSVTLLSDALHDLGDSLSLGLSWMLDTYAHRQMDERYSYGYQRFSLLGALINSVILIVGSAFVIAEAIPRLINPEPSNARGMLFFAIAGIVINGAAVLRLRTGKSLNAQVVMWHLLEDVLGWVAVLIISIILIFRKILILDPIASIVITLYVAVNVLGNFRKTLKLFLQGVPEEYNAAEISQQLTNIPKVLSTHHTHIWSLDGINNVLTTHVIVDSCCDRVDVQHIKHQIHEMIADLHVQHVTLEVEYAGEACTLEDTFACPCEEERTEMSTDPTTPSAASSSPTS
jgi:cobalt-zinc-cadmium efflux system protein